VSNRRGLGRASLTRTPRSASPDSGARRWPLTAAETLARVRVHRRRQLSPFSLPCFSSAFLVRGVLVGAIRNPGHGRRGDGCGTTYIPGDFNHPGDNHGEGDTGAASFRCQYAKTAGRTVERRLMTRGSHMAETSESQWALMRARERGWAERRGERKWAAQLGFWPSSCFSFSCSFLLYFSFPFYNLFDSNFEFKCELAFKLKLQNKH
jgi:hypothetical protein